MTYNNQFPPDQQGGFPPGQYGPAPRRYLSPDQGGPPPPRKRHTVRNVILGVVGAFVLIGIIGAVAGGGSKGATPSSASAATNTAPAVAPASPAAPAPAAKRKVIAKFTGSGDETTAKFQVPDSWVLKYSFNCANFGQSGNFAVSEDNDNDINGVDVNALALRKHGTTHVYSDAGSHYLSVLSECNWTVRVEG